MTIRIPHRRRASIYVLALGTALLVTVIGVSAVMTVRTRQEATSGSNDFVAARYYAQTAVEIGMYTMAVDPDWRTNLSNGVWISKSTFGDGSITLRGEDPADNDLGDDESERVVLTGSGICGPSRYHLQVTLVPPLEPLEALNTCLHAAGGISVEWTIQLNATGAPVSTNAALQNWGYVNSDVEALLIQTVRAINGTVTTGAAAKAAPNADVFDKYVALARQIPFPGNINGVVLAKTVNPVGGGVSPDGIYYIDTGGSDIWIQTSRLECTLLINTQGATAHVANQIFARPASPEYPALVVKGNLNVGLDSGHPLREWETYRNYNPPQAPYEGLFDTDTSDEYPSEIRGLVHATGNFRCEDYSKIVGAVICEGLATCEDRLDLEHTPSLYASPPLHYTHYGVPIVEPGSWRQALLSTAMEAEAEAKEIETEIKAKATKIK